MTTTVSSETPEIENVIQKAIDFNLSQINICLPGIVQKYDKSKQLADVQPALKRKYADGRIVSLPVIPSVPVVQPRSGKAIVHLPVKAGDTVVLIFSQRSLDKWLNQGGVVDPADARKFHLTDAYAIPGGYPFSDPATVADSESLWIQNDTTKFRLKPDGKIQLQGKDGEEVVKILKETIEACEAILTNTMLGPQPPVNKATFTALKARADKLVI